ncbi:MAG: adenylyl-sulfate kinase, partial [Mycobacterium sp.]
GVADLAALSDGLRAEREQGITIDVAYRFFSTANRSYILADTPGHERYTRNMFTGASNAHVAILLVDARAGVLRQTRRHARIAKLLGIKHFVATVNKIDLVDFDQARFTEVESELQQLSTRLGGLNITVIPIAAKLGDNVVHRSDNTPWYDGPTLLDYLENVELAAPQAEPNRLRLPIQWVSRPTDNQRRRYTGRLAAGTLSVGDPVISLPAGTESTVTALDTLDDERTTGVAPLSVSVELADDIDVGRGDVLVSGADDAVLPVLARELDANVCWFVDSPLRAGDRLALKQTSTTVRTTVQALHSRLDPETLDELDGPVELTLNDIGTVTLRTSSLVIADSYADNRDTGAFILIDEVTNDTVGAGTIIEAREVKPGTHPRSDIRWHPSALDRKHRWQATGQAGATIWFTGLPASGKSTVAVAVERALVESGRVAYLLDGDNLRHGLSDDLGFSPGDRTENIRRVGHLTRLLADAGVVALASLVSPLKSDRETARALSDAAKLPFIEVHIATSLAECEKRDPKGLYARARSGELKGLTGVDAPYEPPDNPDLVLDTAGADTDDLVARVIALLDERSPRPSSP